MAFNPDTTTMQDAKTGAVPFGTSEQILTDVKRGSAFMRLAKAVPMKKPQEKFYFMSGVGAYWVGEGKRIQTSKPQIVEAVMTAKKLGVIIPTTKENLKYSVTNFFAMMQEEAAEAFHVKFDQASFCGIDSPFLFSVLKAAQAAGHITVETSNKYDDLNKAMGFIEAEDFDANGICTLRVQKQKYRGTKDEDGRPIFHDANKGLPPSLMELPVAYAKKDSFRGSDVTEFVGDWNKAYYGILSGIEFEVLTEATLTTIEAADAPGEPVSLAERDMAAIKCTMEVGMMTVKDEAFAAIEEAAGA